MQDVPPDTLNMDLNEDNLDPDIRNHHNDERRYGRNMIMYCIDYHGSHQDWKLGEIWKNGKTFSSQGKVREFCEDWRSQGILLKMLENQKNLYWKIEKNTGKVRKFVSQ